MSVLIDKTRNYFKTKISYKLSRKEMSMAILCICLFSIFFLLFFQPFGINNYDPKEKISFEFAIIVCSLGVVLAITLFSNEFLFKPIVLKELTIGSLMLWLIWTLILVSSITFLFYNFMGNWHDLKWTSYLEFIVNVSTMSIFPLAAIIFYFYQKSLNNNIQYLNANQNDTLNPYKLILFTAENEKERIALTLQSILYIESQDNYAAIFHLEEGKIKKHLLRSSLKRLEELVNEPSIIRCHRSYIVNLYQLENVNGNRHQLQLKLIGVDKLLPVSRNFTSKVMKLLEESA